MSNNTSLVTDTAAMELGSEEMLTLSPVVTKSTPTATARNSEETFTPPPRLNRPTLQHQHSYAGHEASFASDADNSNHSARAPSRRPYLATRHISMEELGSNHRHPSNSSSSARHGTMEEQQQQQRTPPPTLFQSQWTLQPSYAINPHASYHPHQMVMPRNGFHNNSSSRDMSHSFSIMQDHPSPAFSPMGGDDAPREQPPDSPCSNLEDDNHHDDDSMEEDDEPGTPPQQQQSPPQREESAEERTQREEDESLALAQMLMAEEAMASHRMSADFLRMNSDQFSAEDFEALQNALQEEDAEEEEVVDGDEEDVEEMSYDALLQLGERIGDVKTDRWTMIAHKEIAKLETYEYDPDKLFHATRKNDSNKDGANSKCCEHKKRLEDIDDSEIKCLVCQFPYEKGDQLRKLPCGHCFHKDCVDQWLMTKDICAYCRQSIICKSDNKDEKKESEASGNNTNSN